MTVVFDVVDVLLGLFVREVQGLAAAKVQRHGLVGLLDFHGTDMLVADQKLHICGVIV
jgi:hypothetical protein